MYSSNSSNLARLPALLIGPASNWSRTGLQICPLLPTDASYTVSQSSSFWRIFCLDSVFVVMFLKTYYLYDPSIRGDIPPGVGQSFLRYPNFCAEALGK